MKVQCSQEVVKQTLAACTALERAYPEITQVCLTAKAPSPEKPGYLEVFTWSAIQTLGLVTHLPAQVERAGQVVVQVKSVAEGLASAHPGQVTLSLVEVEPPVASPVAKQERIKALKGGPALQIESACTSARGTVSTRRIRIRLSPSQQEAPVMVVPDVAFWHATGVRRAEVAPAQLRTALASCLSLARQRAASSELFPDMNHALVLVRFDAAHLQWTATTRSNVVGWHLPLPTPALPMPYTHALFDERVLTWICAALVGVKRPVKLTLVPQAQKQVLLLVESAHMTLFCLGVTEPIPFVWEQRLQLPATTTLLVPRTPFLQALSFWASRSGEAGVGNRHLQVSVTRNLLCLQGKVVGKVRDPSLEVEQQILLLTPADDISPLLVDLQQMRQFVRSLKGPVICLEIGEFRHKEQEKEVVTGFLRFSVPADPATPQLMMTTSQRPSSEASAAENEASIVVSDGPEAERKEAVLANV